MDLKKLPDLEFLNRVLTYPECRAWAFEINLEDIENDKIRKGLEIVKENIKDSVPDLFMKVSRKTGISYTDLLQADEVRMDVDLFNKELKRRRAKRYVKDLSNLVENEKITNSELSNEFIEAGMILSNEKDFQFKDMNQIGDNLHGHYERIWKGEEMIQLPFMKDLVEDLLGGELIILAGRPSMGKSCVMLNQSVILAKNDIPSAYISLEMSAESQYQRIVQRHYDISLRKQKRYMTSEQRLELAETINSYKDMKLYISDNFTSDLGSMIAAIESIVRTRDVKIVFIDYLQLISGDSRKSKNEEVSEITRALKVLATRLQIPIVLGSQLSRAVEQREDKRPKLSDLRDSGSIEQDADVVIFCYRDGYYNYQTDEEELELIVRKQRNGALGTRNLRMVMERQLITNE